MKSTRVLTDSQFSISRAQPPNCLVHQQSLSEENAIGSFQLLNLFLREVLPFQPQLVDSIDSSLIAAPHRLHERQGIARQHRVGSQESIRTHPTKLLDPCKASKNSVVSDLHVSRQRSTIGKHCTVSKNAIMSYMDARHEQVVVSKHSFFDPSQGTPG